MLNEESGSAFTEKAGFEPDISAVINILLVKKEGQETKSAKMWKHYEIQCVQETANSSVCLEGRDECRKDCQGLGCEGLYGCSEESLYRGVAVSPQLFREETEC